MQLEQDENNFPKKSILSELKPIFDFAKSVSPRKIAFAILLILAIALLNMSINSAFIDFNKLFIIVTGIVIVALCVIVLYFGKIKKKN